MVLHDNLVVASFVVVAMVVDSHLLEPVLVAFYLLKSASSLVKMPLDLLLAVLTHIPNLFTHISDLSLFILSQVF